MSDIDTLKAEVKKLASQASQAKLDLHDLSEELPIAWETIPDVAKRCFDLYARLDEARKQLKAAGG